VQIIELKRFGGAPHHIQFAPLWAGLGQASLNTHNVTITLLLGTNVVM
jgi:hypothetical protein